MPNITSISTYIPPYSLPQSEIELLTKELFEQKMPRLERLLKVFANGGIETRHFCVPPDWYRTAHTFEERNALYVELATAYSVEVIQRCLANPLFLAQAIRAEDIDAIIFVSSTGISTPSIEARVMNRLPFSDRVVRMPLWGLGCAGGAAGISRAYDYCKAYPEARVLVVCVELCSLTFQKDDYSKSNLVGASLFADGAACVLVCGDAAGLQQGKMVPHILGCASKWLPDSEEVMGWDVKDSGLHVVFSKSIPALISNWLRPFIEEFLSEFELTPSDMTNFVAHPGGKKVLAAYEEALGFTEAHTEQSRNVLKHHGNMSSPTVLYVLEQFMQKEQRANSRGLLVALGPGFSGEAVLLEWRE
ncbi:MAG: 3-oxoacyl-[acyl-carrier-protein] synthase III C-terminal domain-containing protein [Solibacillus sp.]